MVGVNGENMLRVSSNWCERRSNIDSDGVGLVVEVDVAMHSLFIFLACKIIDIYIYIAEVIYDVLLALTRDDLKW